MVYMKPPKGLVDPFYNNFRVTSSGIDILAADIEALKKSGWVERDKVFAETKVEKPAEVDEEIETFEEYEGLGHA